MDALELSKKEKLYQSEREYASKLSNPAVSMKELTEAQKAVDVAKAELEGRVLDSSGFGVFLKEFVKKHPTWFTYEMIEWANDRREKPRNEECDGKKAGIEMKLVEEEWDGREP